MLSLDDKSFLSENALIVDHSYPLMSLVLGEPFLNHGILHYFDGEMLTINGYLLSDSMDTTLQSIDLVIQRWLDHSSLNAIAYFGPLQLATDALESNGFTAYFPSEPNPYLVDMAIDLTQDLTKLAKRDARRASQKGLAVRSVKLDLLNYSHIQILKEFMLVHEVDPLNRALISTLNAYLRDPDTYVLEVWQENTLVGFATLSLTFSTRPFLTLSTLAPLIPLSS